jgi:8-oxo-dGTP diphosphatase
VILLVRHGVAVSRRSWSQRDDARPLNRRGLRQAALLPAQLAAFSIDRVVSSSALRCTTTT